ncbi:MAG: adenylate/guanylate cyclase domain-containing protein [Massilia sp.]|uniref:CHASE2 domain-containing protein n=1 Tax=Massilia sp. TaxID=1882437 RepID=UPI002FC69723
MTFSGFYGADRVVSATTVRALIALAALALCVLPQWTSSPAPALDEWLRDHAIRWHAVATPERRILVIDIDESSLERLPWPWPRARIADMVEMVLQGGARGVALDILQEKPADSEGDARIAMLAAHGPLVLAQMFDFVPREPALRIGVPTSGRPASGMAAQPASGYIANHAGLAQAAWAGNIGVQPDTDGVLRRLALWTSFEGAAYPALSLALLQCCSNATHPQAAGVVRIPYRRQWDAYDVVKAADLLEGRMPTGMANGRLVLIGSSSLSIGDRIATPLGASTAGLLVHAAMLGGMLDQAQGLAPAVWPGQWIATTFSLLAVVLAVWTLPRRSAAHNVALLVAASAAWLALAAWMAPHDARYSPGAPLLALLFLMGVAVPFQWQLSQQRSQRLLGTLRQYVARPVVDELLRSGLRDPLAPRRLEVTTLIADMEDYTRQVESLSLEEAARLTTDFLDCLTRPVLDKRGTLDKYTGDGLVAFWGAPLPNDDHADLALDAARLILTEVAQFSRARIARGLAPLRVRIGIESGIAMAGDYGTQFRSIYTAVGDSVNTASRLEQAARDYPHDVIVGEGTARLARRHRLQALGERQLRGKEHPIRIFTLMPQDDRA